MVDIRKKRILVNAETQCVKNKNLLTLVYFFNYFISLGDMMQPANKAELKRDFRDASHYISKIKQTPSQGTRRRRNQRKRDKKILKEYNEYMKQQGEDPSAIYDGGRRRRTRKHKHTRKSAKK